MIKAKRVIKSLLPLLGISLITSVSVILTSWLLFVFANTHIYYLLSLLALVISSFYGKKNAALLTLLFTTIAINYLFVMPTFSFSLQSVETMIELGSFLLAGSVVIIVLNKIKNTKEIIQYKNKEKEYQELLTMLQKENKIYQKEITARDEFLSIASHELKTPLSAMLLQIQNALHNIRSVSLANFSVENLLKMLQSTEQQSKRLSKMINDLLNVSLITTGKMELEKEKFDVGELVMDVTDRLSERAEREGSKISLKIQEKVIGNFDKLRIEQAITNLVSNAIKYGEGKSIAVEVNKDNHTINIIVSDHGIGIPKEQQQKIFERFERAVSQHDYKGLGVGLYITQHIVATHGGKITVKSKETEGTTFTISLPVE